MLLSTTDIIIRIVLSCVLGGLIGIERESINRPAGFRTHILVCIGSTIVMLTGIFLLQNYKAFTQLDPARMGAQVISGIGFLGAGTILREGLTVKGLTTAASLWAVGCIGLAIGSGFYIGAVLATSLVFITLMFFSKLELFWTRKHNELLIKVITLNRPGQIGKIGTELGRQYVSIINISLEPVKETNIAIFLTLKTPRGIDVSKIIERLEKIEGVTLVEIID
ncbi:MAG: putative Mg2+ transporter-C (MgtC) family protein [Candidatus Petromonas sp.]|jgi:putative Mg2+ transporter-C (MgtC) family protein|nr:putative Mg2+ transporter-C (MgtC) family protein [Candidatus Petromonas sp.]